MGSRLRRVDGAVVLVAFLDDEPGGSQGSRGSSNVWRVSSMSGSTAAYGQYRWPPVRIAVS